MKTIMIRIISVVIIFTLSCGLSQDKTQEDENVKRLCQDFIKAICTKDTLSFYKYVDKAVLTETMNGWIKDGKKLTQDELFFPFFFVYSPLKIRQQDLTAIRNKEKFFKEFKITGKKDLSATMVKVHIEWNQNEPNSEIKQIDLTLRKSNDWKIVAARWKTL